MRTLLLLVLAGTASAQTYDLLLKGGHVIDPRNGIDAPRDIAILAGHIAAVEPNIPAARARQTLDLTGLTVTPGLIDIHSHLFYSSGIPNAWAGDNSVPPDAFSFRTGCTTMVDAGSAGWRNFDQFRTLVIDRAQTRVLSFVNIAGLGMVSNAAEQTDFDPKAVARVAAKHKDIVVGVKAAHYEKPDWDNVDNALAAGRLANLPVMVDFGHFLPQRPYYQLVGEKMRPGDISTHCFRGPVPWVDEQGKLYDYLRKARERGIIFDVGHGGGSFVFRNAAPAVAQGMPPDTISTDLHTTSMNAGMQDMPTTMSKMMSLGMTLPGVIKASTWRAAQVIRHEELGHLTPGAVADIAAFRVMKGEFRFYDAYGASAPGTQRLQCELTLKDGKVVWNWNGRGQQDWQKLGPTYGVRDIEHIVRPPRPR